MTSKSLADPRANERPAWLQSRERALAEVFARNGFAGTRMDDLVTASGVPRATLYYHFRSKQAVLGWLMDTTVERFADAVRTASRGESSARVRLEAVIRAVLAEMSAYPEACQVLIGNLEQAGRLADTVEGIVMAFHAPVMGLLEQGRVDGSLREVHDPASTSSALFGAVTISALQSLVVHGQLTDGLADALVGLVLDGLAPRP